MCNTSVSTVHHTNAIHTSLWAGVPSHRERTASAIVVNGFASDAHAMTKRCELPETSGNVSDAITVATTGLANNASVASTSTGNNATDGTQAFNPSGATVTLPAETFAPGSQANYTTTVACTGATTACTTPTPWWAPTATPP